MTFFSAYTRISQNDLIDAVPIRDWACFTWSKSSTAVGISLKTLHVVFSTIAKIHRSHICDFISFCHSDITVYYKFSVHVHWFSKTVELPVWLHLFMSHYNNMPHGAYRRFKTWIKLVLLCLISNKQYFSYIHEDEILQTIHRHSGNKNGDF